MRLSHLENLRKRKLPNTWETLEKIQHLFGWTAAELCDRLGMTDKQYQYMRGRNMEPKIHSVSQLIEYIGLSVETIVTGTIDYQALKAHVSGDRYYLPERYQVGAFSKRRTSINLLEYLEDRLGWKTKKNILNHFQVTEAIFSDPESLINFLFPSDLCSFLERSGYSTSIFPMMGAYSVVTNLNTDLGRKMASFKTPKVLHEQLFAGIAGNSFDRNCDYRLMKLNERECLIEAKFTGEVQELLKTKKLGSAHTCATRGGSFGSLPGYLHLPFSRVEEATCIHRGDGVCTYRIHYEHAEALSAMRSFQFESTVH